VVCEGEALLVVGRVVLSWRRNRAAVAVVVSHGYIVAPSIRAICMH
jgi:hypothetical protein